MLKASEKLKIARDKELRYINRQETLLRNQASKESAKWKALLSEKVPEKVYDGLLSAFCKAFTLILQKGTPIINKTLNSEEMNQNHRIRDYAIKLKGSRQELKRMRKIANKSDLINSAVTTLEGVGLGALGVGMPDIVMFLSYLFRGAYETVAQYGGDYNKRSEQFLILCMMEASLSRKEAWVQLNDKVDRLLMVQYEPSDEEFKVQIRRTANCFAVDMLMLKFVQGIPVIGILGGLGNPVYYHKINRYIKLKYYKRYLFALES